MKTGRKGVTIIKYYEGFVDHPYNDVAGYPTIGYGHRITLEEPHLLHQTLNKVSGEQLLKKDLCRYEEGVEQAVHVPLTQNQFDALVSFTYNLGLGNLRRSTLLKKINQQDYEGAVQEFAKWKNANGQTYEGLVQRRKAEANLFGHHE